MNYTCDVKILIVARPGDIHADQVERELIRQGISVLRMSLNTLRSTRMSWMPDGCLTFFSDSVNRRADANTTIWWRRPGKTSTDDLAPDEARLIAAECHLILRGILESTGARWVDAPVQVELAENKLYQLSMAHRLGIRTPPSLLTNDSIISRDFSLTAKIVAKPISFGSGLSPFVEEVPTCFLDLVEPAPVLLQELVSAEADVRIVTVGVQVFAWKRKRSIEEPVDWRRVDPSGRGFHIFESIGSLGDSALKMANALGLSTTVQDWLDTTDGYLFLEVNPQGQWLFLQNATTTIMPAFVRHLLGQ